MLCALTCHKPPPAKAWMERLDCLRVVRAMGFCRLLLSFGHVGSVGRGYDSSATPNRAAATDRPRTGLDRSVNFGICAGQDG